MDIDVLSRNAQGDQVGVTQLQMIPNSQSSDRWV